MSESVPKSPRGDYNYHTWSKFMVRKPEDAPTGSHYAAVMFDRVSVDTGYPDHPGERAVTDYFCLPDRAHLEAWLAEATLAKKKFFFFHVPAVGNAKLRIEVDVGLPVGDSNPQHSFGHGRGD